MGLDKLNKLNLISNLAYEQALQLWWGQKWAMRVKNKRASGQATHAALWNNSLKWKACLQAIPNQTISTWIFGLIGVQLRFEYVYPYHTQHKTAVAEPLTIPTDWKSFNDDKLANCCL